MKKAFIILLFCSIAFGQQKAYKVINSFNGGELSPLAKSREDLSKFHTGCETMENMIPLPLGPAQKRPGTKYVAELNDSTAKGRIIPFEYSTEQGYIILLENQRMQFFTGGTTPAVVYKPYGTETLTTAGTPVSHWKCNDNAANTTVTDAQAAHNGTASANTTSLTSTDAEGTANAAFDLADTYYFTVADHADFTFGDGTDDSPFSFILWAYFATGTETGTLISKDTVAGNLYEYTFGATSGNLFINLNDASQFAAGWFLQVKTNDTISAGWHFVGITYSGIRDSGAVAGEKGEKIGIKMYLDFAQVPTNISVLGANYAAMENTASELCIGAAAGAHGAIWDDKIDNVAIFNKELTPAEIASLTGNDSTTVYSLATPYLTADLFELKFEQSADVLFLSHPDYETRKLSRYGDAVWLLGAIEVEDGPFLDENTNINYTITPSAVTGSITLTASGFSPFKSGTTAGHLPSGALATSKSQTGALFKIVQPLATQAYYTKLTDNYTNDQTENTSWLDCGSIAKGVTWYLTTLGTWTGTIKVQRSYVIGAAAGDSTWEDVPGATFKSTDDRNITTNATEDVAEADYRVIMTTSGDAAENCSVYFRISDVDHVGIVEITAVTNGQTATATVLKTLANTNATHRWAEGSWSNYRGWPRTVAFFEDRLTFGGNSNQPDTIWGSATSDYENFLPGTDDDDPVTFTLSSRQVNVIEWMVGKDKLLIGTSGAEWTISGSADEPLTPSNVIAKQHSNFGSADLQAVLANESVLFFQRGAEKMRELAYNWELDSYVAPDMTILAEHITGDGITDIAYQKTPTSILYCVRDDGQMPIFVYDRKELITSWARFITDGTFESVAVISGDPEDQVWTIANRTINSATVRYVEYFANRDFGTDVDDAYFVDSGITYDSTATTTITGLDHLEAETVAVLGDGAVQTSQVVSSGQITITSASTVQAGMPFTVQMKTMPMSMVNQGANVLGRMQRINQVIPWYYNSGDFYVGKDATTNELLSISGMDSSDVDTDDRVTFPPGYDRFGQVFIYQQSPEPLTLLSLGVEVGFN